MALQWCSSIGSLSLEFLAGEKNYVPILKQWPAHAMAILDLTQIADILQRAIHKTFQLSLL